MARRNGWELAGPGGNVRAPINRETYRVLATLDDGGLVVQTLDGSDRLLLPASYVHADVILGYAGSGGQVERRDPISVLAGILGSDTDPASAAALAQAEDSAQLMRMSASSGKSMTSRRLICCGLQAMAQRRSASNGRDAAAGSPGQRPI